MAIEDGKFLWRTILSYLHLDSIRWRFTLSGPDGLFVGQVTLSMTLSWTMLYAADWFSRQTLWPTLNCTVRSTVRGVGWILDENVSGIPQKNFERALYRKMRVVNEMEFWVYSCTLNIYGNPPQYIIPYLEDPTQKFEKRKQKLQYCHLLVHYTLLSCLHSLIGVNKLIHSEDLTMDIGWSTQLGHRIYHFSTTFTYRQATPKAVWEIGVLLCHSTKKGLLP